LPVGQLGFFPGGLVAAERAPAGPPRSVGLDLATLRRPRQRHLGILVTGEFTVRRHRGGTLGPGVALVSIVWDRSERSDRPCRTLCGDLMAELVAAGVGGVAEFPQVPLPRGVVDGGHPAGVVVAGGVQVDGVGDPVVQNGGEAAGVVEVATGSGLAQHGAWVVAGDLGLAQYPVQAEEAVVGGQSGALARAEHSVVDELVE
jgi:hypothetical protein